MTGTGPSFVSSVNAGSVMTMPLAAISAAAEDGPPGVWGVADKTSLGPRGCGLNLEQDLGLTGVGIAQQGDECGEYNKRNTQDHDDSDDGDLAPHAAVSSAAWCGRARHRLGFDLP